MHLYLHQFVCVYLTQTVSIRWPSRVNSMAQAWSRCQGDTAMWGEDSYHRIAIVGSPGLFSLCPQ